MSWLSRAFTLAPAAIDAARTARTASGVGVEKIFPLFSPVIDKIEVLKRSKVRRAKLYHIREKAAKEVSHQMRNIRMAKDVEVEETVEAK